MMFVWEQRKLLSCIEKITDFRGRTPKKLGMDWSEEGYLALSSLNVKDGYIDFIQEVHYGDQKLYDKWMKGNELHKGQVLFTTEAPMENVAQIPDNRRYILSQRTIVFDVKSNIMAENFLAVVLRTSEMFAKLTVLASGGTAKGVSQKSLAFVDVIFPFHHMEQEKLAELFWSLDHIITLHQCEYIDNNSVMNNERRMIMKLYHGSNMAVKDPKILKSKRLLDFGTGFYVTSDYEQAKNWSLITTRRRNEGNATISVYELDENLLSGLSVKRFNKPDKEWLRYVCNNRTDKYFKDNYDIVIGPVANDQAIRTVNNYLKGYFDEDVAIQLLLPQKLKDQYVFKTEKALSILKLIEVRNI